ncbi:MAG: serine/threonine transporter SstT [Lactobacillaceae bacterium]|jgi:serine/threonine transporter|nr:serine/threonine transporter SstT [Lactobacillaceae bacterium]
MFKKFMQLALPVRILIGMALGILAALIVPHWSLLSIFGDLFVGALKGIAPFLVFLITIAAIAKQDGSKKTHLKVIISIYLVATFAAAILAVVMSYLFPIAIPLGKVAHETSKVSNIGDVLQPMLANLVQNPLTAIMDGNYLSILLWASILGFALKKVSPATKASIQDFSTACQTAIKYVINLAPLGVFGLVFHSVATTGFKALMQYGQIVILLVVTMSIVAFVIYPLIVLILTKRNPYPLVMFVIKNSAIHAFFTRSSAANIPVNMELAKKLGLDETTYSISLPLGATINMGGAAVTISTMTLAATHTLGIPVQVPVAILLSILASLAACGASGIAGGSLLLIPMACNLFGINNTVAMQVVAVGFIIGVVQDSVETALNSSSDLLFTATAEYAATGKHFTAPE